MRVFKQNQRSVFRIAGRYAIILGAAVFLPRSGALAINYTWSGATGDNWDASSSWTPSGVPDDTSLVTFPTIGSYMQIDRSFLAPLYANSLSFNTTTQYSINNYYTGISSLHVKSGTITRTAASSGTQTIDPHLMLGANAIWTINGGGALVFDGGTGED